MNDFSTHFHFLQSPKSIRMYKTESVIDFLKDNQGFDVLQSALQKFSELQQYFGNSTLVQFQFANPSRLAPLMQNDYEEVGYIICYIVEQCQCPQ